MRSVLLPQPPSPETAVYRLSGMIPSHRYAWAFGLKRVIAMTLSGLAEGRGRSSSASTSVMSEVSSGSAVSGVGEVDALRRVGTVVFFLRCLGLWRSRQGTYTIVMRTPPQPALR